MNKYVLISAVILVLSGLPGISSALQDLTSELPDAKAGECYAKVVYPAKFKTESTMVVVQEESESLEIEPARYQWVKKLVPVEDASSELTEVPAQFSTVAVPYQVSPASTRWVMGSIDSSIPANTGLLALAKAGGADVDNARPGQCFDEHYKPATYHTVTEQIMIAEAVREVTLLPAKYEWVEERILIAPASKEQTVVPAVFETVSERIKVEDAKTVWKPGPGAIEKVDYASGETMHLVDVPAVYKTLTKRVLKEAPRTVVVDVPARYEKVRVRRLLRDAMAQWQTVPARYRDVNRQELASPAVHQWFESKNGNPSAGNLTGVRICLQGKPEKIASVEKTVVATPTSVKRIEFPAKYDFRKVQQLVTDAKEIRSQLIAETKEVSKRTMIAEQRMEWRRILCKKNASKEVIQRIQRALTSMGHSPGPIDGVLGYRTMAAIQLFQEANGLATGGLTFDTLDKLGISM